MKHFKQGKGQPRVDTVRAATYREDHVGGQRLPFSLKLFFVFAFLYFV